MDLSTLKTLIFQAAGSEYHRVEVSDTQFNSFIVPHCIEWLNENSDEATRPDTYQLMLSTGVKDYTLPSYVFYVTGYYPDSTPYPMSRRKYIYEKSGLAYDDMVTLAYSNAYMRDMELNTGIYHTFHFNTTTKLFTLLNTESLSSIYLSIYRDDFVTSSYKESMFENKVFQRLILAHTYIQWARNLKKYNRELIGGSTLNWEALMEDGKELLEKTEEEIKTKYQEQPEWEFG